MNTESITATHTAGTITVTWNDETVTYKIRKAPAFVAASRQPAWVKPTASGWTPAPFWVTFHAREDLAAREATKRGGERLHIVPVEVTA